MKNKLHILLALVILLCGTARATKRTVLFIGNSYTYTNTMPAMLQAFAAAKGDTLVFAQSDPGGYTFAQHSVYAPTISLIFSQPWDVVVLQEQSQLPAFPPAQVDTEVYPYAHILDSMIHANDTCTQTLFLMTWGHADGDPSNCAFYPPICTYNGMQQSLRESYLQMALDNHADVAPVGAAWKVERDSFPGLWLYQTDSIHPVVAGSYLETTVLYASIFHKPALGCTYFDGLAASDAHTLQRLADKVVLDSIATWQQYGHYPYAGFSYLASGTSVTFTNDEPVTSTHNWSFGDATSSTSANPTHVYAGTGVYVVSHTVTTACFSETLTDTLHIGTTDVQNVTDTKSPIRISQLGGGAVSIEAPIANAYDLLDVYDAQGRSVGHYSFTGNKATLNLTPGLYIYNATSKNQGLSTRGKFVAY